MSQLWQDYCITLTVVLWNRMVNVLGRVGQLEEAKLLIATVALEPSAAWRALRGACRAYGNTKLGFCCYRASQVGT